ncbi:hypothetical protein BaRGS_00021210 [Batillaria attramentaria]|uniref:Uncharacterized protein n=1 Tax=Batillaria attramentaria TaxID=370345 RepID=A0ABD0KJX0_9CAEN
MTRVCLPSIIEDKHKVIRYRTGNHSSQKNQPDTNDATVLPVNTTKPEEVTACLPSADKHRALVPTFRG